MPKNPHYDNVDEYIAAANEAARPLLAELRTLITAIQPNAEEAIRWGLPFYTYKGKYIGIAAYQAHVSFAVSDDLTPEVGEKAETLGYQIGQKRINIGLSQPVPVELLTAVLHTLWSD